MTEDRNLAAELLAALEESELAQRGGYLVVPRLFSRATISAMFEEAVSVFGTANEELRTDPDTEDWRGGVPPRKFLSAAGGPVQDHVYGSPAVAMMLTELIGTPVRPSSNRASYSYYCRPGDHLALHRDVVKCDVSVIVALSDNTGRGEGGELVVYPDRRHEPLSAVRATPDEGAVTVKLVAGETLVLAGGFLPHLLRPVRDGQYRISAPMCFESVPATH